MRYPPDHKDQTRRKIVEVAGHRFRAEGVQAVGVASLMQSAGLTHGGFYAHFSSKDDLVAEAAVAVIDERLPILRKAASAAPVGRKVQAIAEIYLSARHRDAPAHGCFVAALATELGRMSPEVRATVTGRIEGVLAVLDEAARADGIALDARAVFGQLLGSLAVARTVADPALSEQFLAAGRAAIGALVATAPRLPTDTKEQP